MTVQSVSEFAHGGGSFSDGSYSVRVTFKVVCDAGDGADTIRRHSRLTIGSEYVFRNDRNPSLRLKSCDPKPRHTSTDNETVWLADCVYSSDQPAADGSNDSPPGSGGSDQNQDVPSNPFEPTFSTRPFFYRKPQTQAEFLRQVRTEGGVTATEGLRLGGKWDKYVGPVINSALKPIEPQPEVDRVGTAIRMTGGWGRGVAKQFYDNWHPLQGKLNKSRLVLKNPAGTIEHVCEPLTVKLESVVTLSHYGNEQFIPVEFEWAWKPDGWAEIFPDKGSTVVYEEVSGAGDVVAEMHADEAAIRDIRGGIMSDDQPLNGRGELNRNVGFEHFGIEYLLDPVAEFLGQAGAPYTGAF